MRTSNKSLLVVVLLASYTLSQQMDSLRCDEGCQLCTLRMGQAYCSSCINLEQINGKCKAYLEKDVISNCALQLSSKECKFCKEGYSVTSYSSSLTQAIGGRQDHCEPTYQTINNCVIQFSIFSNTLGLSQAPSARCAVCKDGIPTDDHMSCISFSQALIESGERLSQPSQPKPLTPWDISDSSYPWNKSGQEGTDKIDPNQPYLWRHTDSSLPWNKPQAKIDTSTYAHCIWGSRSSTERNYIRCERCSEGFVLVPTTKKCIPINEKTEGCMVAASNGFECSLCEFDKDFYMRSPGKCVAKKNWVFPF